MCRRTFWATNIRPEPRGSRTSSIRRSMASTLSSTWWMSRRSSQAACMGRPSSDVPNIYVFTYVCTLGPRLNPCFRYVTRYRPADGARYLATCRQATGSAKIRHAGDVYTWLLSACRPLSFPICYMYVSVDYFYAPCLRRPRPLASEAEKHQTTG